MGHICMLWLTSAKAKKLHTILRLPGMGCAAFHLAQLDSLLRSHLAAIHQDESLQQEQCGEA